LCFRLEHDPPSKQDSNPCENSFSSAIKRLNNSDSQSMLANPSPHHSDCLPKSLSHCQTGPAARLALAVDGLLHLFGKRP
jgi:hypothetical protein